MPDKAEQPPLVVFSDDWGRHPSSCQHLIKRLKSDFRILWCNTVGTRAVRADSFTLRRGWEKLKSWNKGLRQVSEQMWVADIPMLPATGQGWASLVNRRLVMSRVRKALKRLNWSEPVVVTTLPHIWPLVKDLSRAGLIYYCVDDFSHWPGSDGESVRLFEQDLVRNADRVLAASEELNSRLATQRPTTYFPHAVDFYHFAAESSTTEPVELSQLPRPRIGFFGLIYEQLNFDLLTHVARRFPEGRIVMIGPVAHCPDSFRSLPNVAFVGAKSYEELPQWIAGCDVLILAYRKDEMTRQINPLKLKECLATGKPIVSVDIPEALKFVPHIRVASDQEEFAEQVGLALGEIDDTQLSDARRQAVRGDTWDGRAAELRAILRSVGEDRVAATA